jgi:hypothetical protein
MEKHKMDLWKKISELADSLMTQLNEEKDGYVSTLEGTGHCNVPLMVYFTKFFLKLDNDTVQLFKYAKQLKDMGIEDDLIIQRAKSYEYTPEEAEAFEKWKETTRLLKEKTAEFKSLLT